MFYLPLHLQCLIRLIVENSYTALTLGQDQPCDTIIIPILLGRKLRHREMSGLSLAHKKCPVSVFVRDMEGRIGELMNGLVDGRVDGWADGLVEG